MACEKPTYEQLTQRVQDLETALSNIRSAACKDTRHPKGSCERPCDARPLSFYEGTLHDPKISMLNSISDIVAFYPSPDMKPSWINQALIDATGYSKETLLSMTCHECLFQRDTPCSFCPALKTFETGNPYEKQVETWDGRFWYVQSFPMINENEAFEGVITVTRNITDRKNAEKALQESVAKYQGILSNITDGYYEVDLSGNLTFFNDALCEILGYSRSELMGMNYRSFMKPEDADLVFKTFNQVFTTGSGAKGLEWRAVRKDGTIIYLDTSVSLIQDAEGEIRNFGGITRDVTERRQTETALRRSEGKYRDLFERIPVGLYQTTMDGRIIDANEACLRIFKCPSKEELLRHDARKSYVDPKDGQKFRRELMNNGYINNYETRLYRLDGYRIWVSITAHVIYDECGNVAVIDGSLRDISNRKEKEKQIQESESKYRGLVERSSDVIVLTDISGKPVFWSPSSEQIFGYSMDELMAKRPDELIGLDEHLRRSEFIRRFVDEQQAENIEVPMTRKDGAEIIIEWTATPVYYGKKLTGIQFLGRDITARKQTEAALRKSHEELRNLSKHLESAREQERKVIAREVHDDLGQSLTAIKFDLAYMKRHMPDIDADKLLEKIESTTSLVNESLQSVKRISSRLRPGILTDLGLEAAMEWYLEDFRKRTAIKYRSSIQRLEFSDDVLCNEICVSIFRIFQEALTNVARHSAATEVVVKLEKAGDWIGLEVNDNGIGITEADIHASDSYGLLGIRERANAFDGNIDISGEVKKGTSLRVNFPVRNKLESSSPN